jgi:hypothetical protein
MPHRPMLRPHFLRRRWAFCLRLKDYLRLRRQQLLRP